MVVNWLSLSFGLFVSLLAANLKLLLTLHLFCALTLFITACISRQEEHRGTGEFKGTGLLGVQTLTVQVEPIRWVQSGHTTRQGHPLWTQHAWTQRWFYVKCNNNNERLKRWITRVILILVLESLNNQITISWLIFRCGHLWVGLYWWPALTSYHISTRVSLKKMLRRGGKTARSLQILSPNQFSWWPKPVVPHSPLTWAQVPP